MSRGLCVQGVCPGCVSRGRVQGVSRGVCTGGVFRGVSA